MKEQVPPLLKELESSKTMLKNLIGTPSATLVRVNYQFFFFFVLEMIYGQEHSCVQFLIC